MTGPHRGVTTDAAPPMVAVAAFVPGTVIAGRYHLQARLGGGGGGTVWRCLDEQLDAIVALKIVSSDGDLERWRREVAMARRIAHRNVCRVHDLGETGEVRFVTMELVEGTSLRSRVRPDLPAAEARDLVQQIVAGAAAIHAAGVVHRDLKPENIVVAHDGRAVIVDFGLAREPGGPFATLVERRGPIADGDAVTLRAEDTPARTPGATVTSAGVAVGTPRYMSPEQAAGDAVDGRTDVWALGLIAHELLCGKAAEPVPQGRAINPAIDAKWPRIGPVVARCLAMTPDDRFADARALAAALPPIGRRRWPWIAGGLAGLTGVAIAVAVAASDGGGDAAPVTIGPGPGPKLVAPNPQLGIHRLTPEPPHWPRDMPMSVAVARDGERFAYTTPDLFPRLLVRAVDGAGEPDKWPVPELPHPGRKYGARLVMAWAVGWFSDGSIALAGTTERDGYVLFRTYRNGQSTLLHQQVQRFRAAVATDDRVLIGVDDDGIFSRGPGGTDDPEQVLRLGSRERIAGLAWSPDGKRFAVARTPAGEPTRIVLASATGDETRELWRGTTAASADMLLIWLDDTRLAFTQHDRGVVRLFSVAIDDHQPRERASWTDYAGAGSAAGGTVVVLRGTVVQTVAVGTNRARDLQPVQPNLAGRDLAGWTTDGRVVFAAGPAGRARVARAVPQGALELWPNTTAGVETPDTVDGDSVIVHRTDPAAPGDGIVIERIGPTGTRAVLQRVAAASLATSPVRCAGDRARPCVLAELAANQVSWRELDPETGTLGPVIHQRAVGAHAVRDAALSPDGKLLAIVEGTAGVSLFDRASSTSRTLTESPDAEMETVAFAPSGELWATSTWLQGRLFGLMAFERDDRATMLKRFASSRGLHTDDAMRWFGRSIVSPDGTRVATVVREYHLHLARITGL